MKRVRILSVSNEVNEKEIIYYQGQQWKSIIIQLITSIHIHKNSYMDVEKY